MSVTEDQNPSRDLILTYAKAIFAALLIAWAVRSCGIEAYRIPNSAMSPTLLPGDTVFVTKWDYQISIPFSESIKLLPRLPQRGDVVVFETRGRFPRETIKRVIGIPGDRILVRKGELFLNGARISDATIHQCGTETLPASVSGGPSLRHELCLEAPLLNERTEVTLKENELFVAPDLRSETALLPPPQGTSEEWERRELASHSWGVIQQNQLLGRARWLWISVSPPQEKPDAGWTSRIRWNRMLRRIDSPGRS